MIGAHRFGRAAVVAVVFIWLATTPLRIAALDCPAMPEQARKDVQVQVKAAVAKIGPVSGAELETVTKAVTRDLMSKLPQADRVYLEQMMYATYCSALRDDKTLSETEKASRIKAYNLEVRRTLQGLPVKPPGTEGRDPQRPPNSLEARQLEARQELIKLSLPYTAEAFVKSAEDGDAIAVKLYLAAGMNPDMMAGPPRMYGTALMRAAANGDLAMVNLLLAGRADVNKKVWGANSALEKAARLGKAEVVRVLLDKGADAESINAAFISAAEGGHLETMRPLLRKGADLQTLGPKALQGAAGTGGIYGNTPAAMVETVKFLLDQGVDVNSRNDKGETSLHLAAYPAVVETLLDRGADINARDQDGATALWWAAGIGSREKAIILINRGADVTAENKDGRTVLWRATYNNDKEIVELLLKHGAR